MVDDPVLKYELTLSLLPQVLAVHLYVCHSSSFCTVIRNLKKLYFCDDSVNKDLVFLV